MILNDKTYWFHSFCGWMIDVIESEINVVINTLWGPGSNKVGFRFGSGCYSILGSWLVSGSSPTGSATLLRSLAIAIYNKFSHIFLLCLFWCVLSCDHIVIHLEMQYNRTQLYNCTKRYWVILHIYQSTIILHLKVNIFILIIAG